MKTSLKSFEAQRVIFSLFSGRARLALVHAFTSGDYFTARDLYKRIGVSAATTYLELDNLVQANLIRRNDDGTYKMLPNVINAVKDLTTEVNYTQLELKKSQSPRSRKRISTVHPALKAVY